MLITDPTRTMEPPAPASMSGRANACAAQNAPVRLVAMTSSQSFSPTFSAEV